MDAKILQSKKMGEGERNKQKIQIGAVIFLALIFVYLLVSTVMGGKNKRPKVRPASGAVPAAAAPAEELFPAETDAKESQAAEPDDWGASPFSMQSSEEPVKIQAKTDLSLKGIVFSTAEESYAIINEKIVKKGERVADNTVKEIFEERVVLQNDAGELITLKR